MKNSNFALRSILIILLLIGAFLFFLFISKQKSNSRVDGPLTIEFVSADQKLLIAKPKSPFKDSITVGIIEHYNSSIVDIAVINVRGLVKTDTADFDAILVMHRWVAGAPIDIVQSFVEKNIESKNKIVMLTTSWNGLEKMENIDAITGASIMDDVPDFTDRIIKRLDRLLGYKD